MNTRFFFVLSVVFVGVGQAECQTPAVEVRPRITGYLTKVHCKEGDAVKKGDLLFEIDATPYQARLDQADAKLALASTQLILARANLERTKKLQEMKVVANAEVEESKIRVEEAQARLAVAKASRAPEAASVAAAKVYAPADGTVRRLAVIEGNLVKADETVLAQLPPAKKPAGASEKIKDLLKERRDVLQKVVDQMQVQFANGRIPVRDLFLAEQAILEADLALAETPKERVTMVRKIVGVVERIQSIVGVQVEAGKAPELELLQARAMTLEMRIRLLREEENAKAQK